MSYSSMIVLVSPNDNIAVCCSQSVMCIACFWEFPAKANFILIKVLSRSNPEPYGPSMQAYKMCRFALARQLQGKHAMRRGGWCACCNHGAAAVPRKFGEDSHHSGQRHISSGSNPTWEGHEWSYGLALTMTVISQQAAQALQLVLVSYERQLV